MVTAPLDTRVELAADSSLERAAAVATALGHVTPTIDICSAAQWALLTRGPARYFGGEEALAEVVHATVADALTDAPADAPTNALPDQPTVGVGVADDFFTASLAAQLFATTVVAVGDSAEFLANWPIAALRIAGHDDPKEDNPHELDEMLGVLARLGKRTLGEVAGLGVADVVNRFGSLGLWAHRLARGDDQRLLVGSRDKDDVSTSREFEQPVELAEQVAFAAKSAADELVDELARRGEICVVAWVEIVTENGEVSSHRWRHERRFDAASLVDRARHQLQGWRNSAQPPSSGVCRLRLTAHERVADVGTQSDFWQRQAAGDERAATAMARLSALLGDDAVRVAQLNGGRRPADQGRWVAAKADAADLSAPWPGALPSPAPAVVYSEPLAATLVDADGATVAVDGRGVASAAPSTLTISGQPPQAVVDWAGPWPLDERWWQPATAHRQARVQVLLDDQSAHLCVLANSSWQVEATYS